MNWKYRVAFVCYLIPVVGWLMGGATYLSRTEFMPYHAVATGQPWEKLSPRVQVLVLALVRLGGAGMLVVAGCVAVLLLLPFRRRDRWALWTIPIVQFTYGLLVFWISYTVCVR